MNARFRRRKKSNPTDSMTWEAWAEILRDGHTDEVNRLVFADWLEDRGLVGDAKQWRLPDPEYLHGLEVRVMISGVSASLDENDNPVEEDVPAGEPGIVYPTQYGNKWSEVDVSFHGYGWGHELRPEYLEVILGDRPHSLPAIKSLRLKYRRKTMDEAKWRELLDRQPYSDANLGRDSSGDEDVRRAYAVWKQDDEDDLPRADFQRWLIESNRRPLKSSGRFWWTEAREGLWDYRCVLPSDLFTLLAGGEDLPLSRERRYPTMHEAEEDLFQAWLKWREEQS